MDRRPIIARAASLSAALTPFGIAFGVAARQAGLSTWEAMGFSLAVFAGSAQFAAVSVLGDGGTVTAAVTAGLLLNLRSLAFGFAVAPTLPAARWKRLALSQLVIDETTAVASAQPDPASARFAFAVSGVSLFVAWNLATLAGAVALGDTREVVDRLGLDATIPAAFLALLWPRLSDPVGRRVALGGAVIALALTPVAPVGVVILASGIALVAGIGSRPDPVGDR